MLTCACPPHQVMACCSLCLAPLAGSLPSCTSLTSAGSSSNPTPPLLSFWISSPKRVVSRPLLPVLRVGGRAQGQKMLFATQCRKCTQAALLCLPCAKHCLPEDNF